MRVFVVTVALSLSAASRAPWQTLRRAWVLVSPRSATGAVSY